MKKALPFIIGLLSFVANAQAPANDNCSNAQVITVGSPGTSGTMAQATNSTIPDCPGTTSYSDVWYQFTATSDMHYVIVNTTTFNARLLVSLFNEDCANLLPIKCNGTTSFYTDNLIVGEEYKIRVYTIYDNPTNLSANFTLSVSTLTTPINPITITDTQYTPEQLVTDIFFNSGCVEVTNITSSTGTDFGNVNGIGYFESNGTDFNLESGIMLSSGSVLNAPGPFIPGNAGNGEVSGSLEWPGDDDVETFSGVSNSYNATILEFDFVAETDNFSFDFLFASREYGPFMCYNSDSMAILLTEVETGTTTNLGVIPGTTTPIRSFNIRPDIEGAICGPLNPQYFDQLYTDSAAITAPVNFTGITVPIQASASIIPGNQYHLKIAIVDNSDPSFASAIFFGPANFDLPELDAEIVSSNGNFICSGQPTTLSIDVDDSLYSIQWSLNGTVIDEATESNFTATQGGVYSATVSLVPGSSVLPCPREK